jgi:hypothetical protein
MKKIDLLQFVLMMYIQQYYSVDLKSSLSAREELVLVFFKYFIIQLFFLKMANDEK